MSDTPRPPKPHPDALWVNGRWYLPACDGKTMAKFANTATRAAFRRRFIDCPAIVRTPQEHQQAVALATSRFQTRKASLMDLIADLDGDPE